jgi:heme oxygenase
MASQEKTEMTIAGADLMVRLKRDTQDLHDAAEAHPFQRTLAKGHLPREAYAQHVALMALLHETLERALDRAVERDASVARVATPRRRHSAGVRADAAMLGADASEASSEAVTEWGAALGESIASCPRSALGALYVLEGATNGGRFIAVNVRRALDLEEGAGDVALNPYGAEQAEEWASFKRDMAGLTFSDEEADAIVEQARATFRVVERMGEELQPAGAAQAG